jgi:DNA-binding transcriptional LysR family regulator
MTEVIGRWIPGVEVQVNVEATPHPIPALLEGKLDFAIAYAKVQDRNLSYSPLFVADT